MRVLIELLDREPIENVLGACVFKPDVVVYLCDERDSAFFKESAIYRVFRNRKIKTQPRFYYFDTTDPAGVRRIIRAIVRDYPGCVFDFSGGRDLLLLVAGACFAEMAMPGFYIDISRGRFIDLRGCAAYAGRFALPRFDVKDVLAMAGATACGHGHFATEALTDDFFADVLRVFEVVAQNPKAWGEFVSWLQMACAGTPAAALHIEAARRRKNGPYATRANPALLQRLLRAGALTRVELAKNHAKLSFKSALIRKCLLIEGIWLELYCYVQAKSSGEFGDVQTSVVVEWDGENAGADTAKNEVDVLLVKDVTPVFVSCKMSLPSPLALSEIKLLSEKFGGRRSRAVVLTLGSLGDNHKALQARAADMGIVILDRAVLVNGGLQRELAAIASPPPPPGALLMNAELLEL